MKVFLLIAFLTAGAFAQTPEYQTTLTTINAVMEQPTRPKWRQYYTMTSDTVGAAAVNIRGDDPLQVITINIWLREKVTPETAQQMDALLADIQKAVADTKHPVSLNLNLSERQYTARGTGQYDVSPVRVTSFCAGSFCSATATGGNVSERIVKIPAGVRVRVGRHWQNY